LWMRSLLGGWITVEEMPLSTLPVLVVKRGRIPQKISEKLSSTLNAMSESLSPKLSKGQRRFLRKTATEFQALMKERDGLCSTLSSLDKKLDRLAFQMVELEIDVIKDGKAN
jgi:hypothetical protein